MQKRSLFQSVPLSFFYITVAELILFQETEQGVIKFSITEWVILSGHYPLLSWKQEKANKGLRSRIPALVCVEFFYIVLGRKHSGDGLWQYKFTH